MKKKILQIIIILVVIVIIGFLAVKFLNEKSTSSMGGKSIIEMTEEQGTEVMSKNEWIQNCEESDSELKDACYSMGALYYRDSSFCKNINNSEIKKDCTKEKIEEYYESLEKGSVGMPTMLGIPMMPGIENSGIGEVGEQENTEGSIVTGEMNDDIIVEIMAITKYIGMLNLTDPQAAQRATDKVGLDGDIYEKFGVTEEEYYAYFDKISGQGELKEMEIMQGVQQRTVELQRTGL